MHPILPQHLLDLARPLVEALAGAIGHRQTQLAHAHPVLLFGPLPGDAQLPKARGAEAVARALLRPPGAALHPAARQGADIDGVRLRETLGSLGWAMPGGKAHGRACACTSNPAPLEASRCEGGRAALTGPRSASHPSLRRCHRRHEACRISRRETRPSCGYTRPFLSHLHSRVVSLLAVEAGAFICLCCPPYLSLHPSLPLPLYLTPSLLLHSSNQTTQKNPSATQGNKHRRRQRNEQQVLHNFAKASP